MTLVWLALILFAFVFGLVILVVNVTTDFKRLGRQIQVDGIRVRRAAEDAAWANRLEHYAVAQAITLRRSRICSVQDLADRLPEMLMDGVVA